MTKYILGGGLASMIFAYYNEDYLIIAPELGGQCNATFNLGPRLLEKSEHTEGLLKELDLSFDTETIKIGFYRDGFQDIKDFSKEDYLLQSRGKVCKEDSGMNGNKAEMEVYKVSFRELSERLASRLRGRSIMNNVEEVSLRRQDLRMAGTEKKFRFHQLVNTIPYKIFLKLCGKEANHEIENVTFVKLKKDFFDMKGFSFVYCLDNYFYRISDHGDYLVVEMRGEYDKKVLSAFYKKYYLDSISMKTQVISEKIESESKNVTFFGRYAEQDKSILIADLIKKAKHLNTTDSSL